MIPRIIIRQASTCIGIKIGRTILNGTTGEKTANAVQSIISPTIIQDRFGSLLKYMEYKKSRTHPGLHANPTFHMFWPSITVSGAWDDSAVNPPMKINEKLAMNKALIRLARRKG